MTLSNSAIAHIRTIETVAKHLFNDSVDEEKAKKLQVFLHTVTSWFRAMISDKYETEPDVLSEDDMDFLNWVHTSMSIIVETTIRTADCNDGLFLHLMDTDIYAYCNIITYMSRSFPLKQNTPAAKQAKMLFGSYSNYKPERTALIAKHIGNDTMDYFFEILMDNSYSLEQANVIAHYRDLCHPMWKTFLSPKQTPQFMDGLFQAYATLRTKRPDADPADMLKLIPETLKTSMQVQTYAILLRTYNVAPNNYVFPDTPDTVCREIQMTCEKSDAAGTDTAKELYLLMCKWDGFTPMLDIYYRTMCPNIPSNGDLDETAMPCYIYREWQKDKAAYLHTSPDELAGILSLMALTKNSR